MDEQISREARGEVLQAVQERYRHATRKEKARILDEVVALTHCHRKHATRLLAEAQKLESGSTRVGKRVYDEAVREALIVIWEASDRICGKRLKAVLPALLESMELHGHPQPTPTVPIQSPCCIASGGSCLVYVGTGRQGRQPMGASAPMPGTRSRWSLNFVKNLTIFEVSSTEGISLQMN